MFKNEHIYVRRFAFLTVLLVMMLAFVGCEEDAPTFPNPPETVEYLITEGWNLLKAGNVDDAITTFNDAANSEATNLEAYLGLGYSYSRNNEPVRAQLNFDNVIALTAVLLVDEIDPISQDYADAILAEAYAGKAAAYLAAQNYLASISNAQACEALWSVSSAPEHRWLENVALEEIQLIEANAQYGAGQYNEAVLIVDDLMGGSFISGASHINSTTETVVVSLLQDTAVTGIAALEVSNFNLIHPVSVIGPGSIAAEVTGFDSAGNTLRFRANPLPTQGDQYTTEYLYADDFGQFLIELREAIAELE
ncbi:hypothetical protein KQI63_06905 [bacterium]|nr:hypothetical protein [bacterium]